MIMNRSDVRLGMDLSVDCEEQEVRIINGVRRGEGDFNPLLIRPAYENGSDDPSGFEEYAVEQYQLRDLLTIKEFEYFEALPDEYSFQDGLAIVPQGTLSRLNNKLIRSGALRKEGKKFKKAETVV